RFARLIPVPRPLAVNFGGRDAYVERLRRMLQTAEARVAIASADLVATLRAAAAGTAADLVGTPDQFKDLPRSAAAMRPLGTDEACDIQFSSGSTRPPRGALVRPRAR